MTRKDYVAIARRFAIVNEWLETNADTWYALRSGIADAFAEDNTNFDRETFFKACEATP